MSNLESNLPPSLAPAGFDTWIRDLAQIVDGRVPSGTADDLVALDGTGGFKTVDSSAYVGSDGTVTQIVEVTQAEYDGLTPDAGTLYVVVG